MGFQEKAVTYRETIIMENYFYCDRLPIIEYTYHLLNCQGKYILHGYLGCGFWLLGR